MLYGCFCRCNVNQSYKGQHFETVTYHLKHINGTWVDGLKISMRESFQPCPVTLQVMVTKMTN